MRILMTLTIVAFVAADSHSSEDVEHYCPSNWRHFHRTMGEWCIRVFSGVVNVYEAQERCLAEGAVLTGVENDAERSYIHANGLSLIRAAGVNEGSVWVGLKRRPDCQGLDRENGTGCVPWVPNAFQWTDQFTTGTSMMQFRPGQPDNYGHNSFFAYMHIIDGTVGDAGAWPGSLDDVGGSVATSQSKLQHVWGYACGKRAKVSNI